jgi:hypothetical protein
VGALRAFRDAPFTGEPADMCDTHVIGRITKAIHAATGAESGQCYAWNADAQCWVIGTRNAEALGRAMKRRRGEA